MNAILSYLSKSTTSMSNTLPHVESRVDDGAHQDRTVSSQGTRRATVGGDQMERRTPQHSHIDSEQPRRETLRPSGHERGQRERHELQKRDPRWLVERGDKYKAKAQHLEGTLKASEAARDVSQQTIAERDRAIVSLRTEVQELRGLLSTRARELDAADAFMSTTDSMTEVETKDAVSEINYESAQVAATLTDIYQTRLRHAYSVHADQSRRIVDGVFGQRALQLLLQNDQADDEFLPFEVLLQGCMVYAVQWIVTRWHFGQDAWRDQVLFESIQQNVGSNGTQSDGPV